jgi:hypothetical protein
VANNTKEGDYLLKGDDNLKQRSFIMKYQDFYSMYNHGKSHNQRRRNKRLGNKKMRNKLKKEMLSSLDW